MATDKNEEAAGLSTAEKDKLDDKEFAFPGERKEPLVDASHVRNAVARFGQVEGVTDTERRVAARASRGYSTTTERSTSPRSIRAKASSTWPMPMVSLTKRSRSSRPPR